MWPSFNQLLCAALPKEIPCETRMGRSLLLHQHVRTAHQVSIQEEKKKLCLTFLRERKSHGLQCIWNCHELAVSYLVLFMSSPSKQVYSQPEMSLLPIPILTTLSSLQIYLPEAYPSFIMQPKDTSTRKTS